MASLVTDDIINTMASLVTDDNHYNVEQHETMKSKSTEST